MELKEEVEKEGEDKEALATWDPTITVLSKVDIVATSSAMLVIAVDSSSVAEIEGLGNPSVIISLDSTVHASLEKKKLYVTMKKKRSVGQQLFTMKKNGS